MIYNCEICEKIIYATDAENLIPKVVTKSVIYLGHAICHTCINDMYKFKETMEVYPEHENL